MIEEEKKKMPGTSKNKNFLPHHSVTCKPTFSPVSCFVMLTHLTFCYPFSAFMKTSLKKPIGIFVQFLKGLESENDNRRKSFRDAEGEWMKWMFAELLCNTEK